MDNQHFCQLILEPAMLTDAVAEGFDVPVLPVLDPPNRQFLHPDLESDLGAGFFGFAGNLGAAVRATALLLDMPACPNSSFRESWC